MDGAPSFAGLITCRLGAIVAAVLCLLADHCGADSRDERGILLVIVGYGLTPLPSVSP